MSLRRQRGQQKGYLRSWGGDKGNREENVEEEEEEGPLLLRGVMIGRAACQNPWMFSDVDRRFYGVENPGFSRREILER